MSQSYSAPDEISKDGSPKSPIFDSITLWPHRSLSQRGFAILIAGLGTLAFVIGLGFFLLGAWPVIGFMGLELLVLYVAFRLNYRDGKACEQLLIHADGLDLIRTSPSGKQSHMHFASPWLRAELIPQKGRRKILALRHHHDHHEIGAFLPPAEKKHIHALINERIDAARNQPS